MRFFVFTFISMVDADISDRHNYFYYELQLQGD